MPASESSEEERQAIPQRQEGVDREPGEGEQRSRRNAPLSIWNCRSTSVSSPSCTKTRKNRPMRILPGAASGSDASELIRPGSATSTSCNLFRAEEYRMLAA